jgi:hypothetical protein
LSLCTQLRELEIRNDKRDFSYLRVLTRLTNLHKLTIDDRLLNVDEHVMQSLLRFTIPKLKTASITTGAIVKLLNERMDVQEIDVKCIHGSADVLQNARLSSKINKLTIYTNGNQSVPVSLTNALLKVDYFTI